MYIYMDNKMLRENSGKILKAEKDLLGVAGVGVEICSMRPCFSVGTRLWGTRETAQQLLEQSFRVW